MSNTNQAVDVTKEITELSERLEQLRTNLVSADKKLQAQTEAMHGEILAGHSAETEVREMAMSQDRKKAIESAIAQLEAKLEGLRAQQKAAERAVAMNEFSQIEARASDHLSDCINKILTAADDLEAVQAEIHELNKIAPRATGKQLAKLDRVSKSAKELWVTFHMLQHGFVSGLASVPAIVKALNRRSAGLVEDARGKRKNPQEPTKPA